MSNCDICKKGLLLQEESELSIDIKCSRCGRGWHIPKKPRHNSPSMNGLFNPPEPRDIVRDEFSNHIEHDEKPEDPEEEEESEGLEPPAFGYM